MVHWGRRGSDVVSGDVPNSTILAFLLTAFDELSAKLDAMLRDETSLREAVLNGHAGDHDEHHRWLSHHMREDCAEVCAWGRAKMAEERNAATSRRTIRDGWIGNLLWAVTTVSGMLILSGALFYLSGARLVI